MLSYGDPDDGDTLTFEIIAGNSPEKAFAMSTIGQLMYAPEMIDFERSSGYKLTVAVIDSGRLRTETIIRVNVQDRNDAPVLLATSCKVFENSRVGTSVCVIDAVDVDGGLAGTMSFSVIDDGSHGYQSFTIDSASGLITVRSNEYLNFETNPNLMLQVCVEDKGVPKRRSCGTYAIEIMDANERPEVTPNQVCFVDETSYLADQSAIDARLDKIVCQLLATDIDSNSEVEAWKTHRWSGTAVSAGVPFYVDQAGRVLIASPKKLDYEAVQNSFFLMVRVTDGGNLVSDDVQIEVRIRDLNEPPTVSVGIFSVAENADSGTPLTGSIQVTDFDKLPNGVVESASLELEIENDVILVATDGTDRLVVGSQPLNFEAKSTYSGILYARDSRGLRSFGTPITIRIENRNEDPIISNALLTIKENSPDLTRLRPKIEASDVDIGQKLRFSIVDEEKDVNGRFESSTSLTFGIEATTGIVYLREGPINYEQTKHYRLSVRVTDDGLLLSNDGSGQISSIARSSTAIVTINIENVNEPPTLRALSLTIDEVTTGEIGHAFSGLLSDPEKEAQEHIFSIESGNDAGIFQIGTTTGQLSIVGVVDHEHDDTHNLVISVADNGDPIETGETTATIYIKDVNEPPMLSSFSLEVPENSAPGTLVGKALTAQDPDDGDYTRLRYKISGGSGATCFDIGPVSGQCTVSAGCALDFEDPLENSFEIQVEVTDGVNVIEVVGSVKVTNVNEGPTLPTMDVIELPEHPVTGKIVTTVVGTDIDANDLLVYTDCGQSTPGAFMARSTADQKVQIIVVDPSLIDFEVVKAMWINVCVQDTGGLTANTQVKFDILDTREPPVFLRSSIEVYIDENVNPNTPVGTSLVDHVSDVDTTDSSAETILEEITFTIRDSTCPIAWFGIDSNDGQLHVATDALDYEDRTICFVDIDATDSDGLVANPPLRYIIHIRDKNDAPKFTKSEFQMSVHETAAKGYTLGFISATDEDQDEILHYKFKTGEATDDPFEITSAGSVVVSTGGVLNFDSGTRSYRFLVEVVDREGLIAEGAVQISVQNRNEPPEFSAPTYTCSIPEDATGGQLVCDISATDVDEGQTEKLHYSIEAGNSRNVFAITSMGSIGRVTIRTAGILDHETVEQFTISVSVQDNGDGNLIDSATVVINVADTNEKPSISDANLDISEGASIGDYLMLPGDESTRYRPEAIDVDDGDILTFSLLPSSDIGFKVDSSTGEISLDRKLNFEVKPVYQLQLQAEDTGGLKAVADITVLIGNANDAPELDIATHMMIEENAPTGSLVGRITATDEDGGQELVFELLSQKIILRDRTEVTDVKLIDGSRFANGYVYLTDNTADIKQYLDFEIAEEIRILVSVADNGSPSLSDEKEIAIGLVDVNENCRFTNPWVELTIDETHEGEMVQVQVVDPDAGDWGDLVYIMPTSLGKLRHAFQIDYRTGRISVKPKIFNYAVEMSYDLSVIATDSGGLSCSGAIMVTLRDVNEHPVIVGKSFTVRESETSGFILGDLFAWDPENDTLSYTLTPSEGEFAIHPSTGVISLKGSLDYESTVNHYHDLVVTVSDEEGLSTDAAVKVFIEDVNEPPVFPPQIDIKVVENAPLGTLVGTIVSANDPDEGSELTYTLVSSLDVEGTAVDYFQINRCSGEIRLKGNNEINYEVMSQYHLIVKVTDEEGLSDTSSTFSVHVLDINEMPTCRDILVNVDENSPAGTVIKSELPWSDPDDHVGHEISVFEIFGSQSTKSESLFEIVKNANDYQLRVNGDLDFEEFEVHKLYVRIADIGTLASGRPAVPLESTCKITVEVNEVDEYPVVDSVTTRQISENSDLQSVVGEPIEATDPDVWDQVSFAISGSTSFRIDPLTGQLHLTEEIDFESQSIHTFDVIVNDRSAAHPVTTHVTVNIQDVNELPHFTRNCVVETGSTSTDDAHDFDGICVSISEGASHGDTILEVEAQDVDAGQSLIYSTITPNAVGWVVPKNARECILKVFGGLLDYETDTKHTIKLKVSDTGAGFLSDTVDVRISVTDVNEAPALHPSSPIKFSIQENVAADVVVGKLMGWDPEEDSVSFLLVETLPTDDLFVILADGTVKTAVEMNYEELQSILAVRSDPVVQIVVALSDGSLGSEVVIPVTILDVQEPPFFPEEPFKMRVQETAASGAYIGEIHASDPDAHDVLTYHLVLSVSIDGLLSINSVDGRISLVEEGVLDKDTTPTYTFQVVARDSVGQEDTSDVVLTVVNDNFAPECAPLACTIRENSELLFTAAPNNEPISCKVQVTDKDDEQAHTYAMTTTDSSNPFTIDPSAGVLRVKEGFTIDYEDIQQYSTQVIVTDVPVSGENPLSCSSFISIQVENVNEEPHITTTQFMVDEDVGDGKVLGRLERFDPDNDGYSFTIEPDTPFDVNPATGELSLRDSSRINFEQQSVWYISARVEDSEGLATTSIVYIDVNDANDAPTLKDYDFAVDEVTNEELPYSLENILVGRVVGRDEDFADANSLRYSIVSDSPDFFVDETCGKIYAAPHALDFETKGPYTLTVQVKDAGDASDTGIVRVNIRNRNEGPSIISAGPFDIPENSKVSAQVGSIIAFDPEVNDETYIVDVTHGYATRPMQESSLVYMDKSYEWTSIPDIFRNSRFLSPIYEDGAIFADEFLEVHTASSGIIYILYDQIVPEAEVPAWIAASGFTKLESEPVIASSGADQIYYNVYSKTTRGGLEYFGANQASSNVLTDASAYVVVAAPDPLSYSLSGLNSELFTIDSTGTLSVAQSGPLNYESRLDASNTFIPYRFVVTVVDTVGVSGKGYVEISLTNVNESPRIIGHGDSASTINMIIEENPDENRLITVLEVADEDLEDTYTFTSRSEVSSPFKISPSGEVRVKTPALLDFENVPTHTFKIRVEDSKGLYQDRTMSIQLKDENERPVFDEEEEGYSFSVDENSAISTPVGQPIHATDVDAGQQEFLQYGLAQEAIGKVPFRVDACSGQILVSQETINFENLDVYEFDVFVTDNGSPRLTAFAHVRVSIINVNEKPSITPVPVLSIAENEVVGSSLAVLVVTDVDADSVHTFSTNLLEFIVAEDGTLRTTKAFDYEMDPISYNLVITATDNGLNGQGPRLSDTITVTIAITPVNEAPTLETAHFYLLENEPVNSAIGSPLIVDDPDASNPGPVFTIVSGSENFKIDQTGQLFALKSFDYENAQDIIEYDIEVMYTDGEFESSAMIKVSIDDKNEAPRVTSDLEGTVEENLPANTQVMTVTWTDVDVGSSNSIVLRDESLPFTIDSASGIISTSRVLDYETGPHEYTLLVKLCDNVDATLCHEESVDISVTDAPDPPSLEEQYCKIIENTRQLAHVTTVGKRCEFKATDTDANSCFTYSIDDAESIFELAVSATARRLSEHIPGRRLNSIDSCTTDPIQLTLKADENVNYELQDQYIVPVIVYDQDYANNGLSYTSRVIVNVEDANDAPVLSIQQFTVTEAPPVNTLVGFPLPADDEDVADVLKYTIQSDPFTGLFAVDAATGQISIGRSPGASEMLFPATFQLTVRVSDSAAPSGFVDATIDISTINNNLAPTWRDTTPKSISVYESLAEEGVVGQAFTTFAQDLDGDALEFSIRAKADPKCSRTFEISTSTGQMSLLAGKTLDFDTYPTYKCTISVCDPHNQCAVHDVDIELQNVNEAPSLTHCGHGANERRRLRVLTAHDHRRLSSHHDRFECNVDENLASGSEFCNCFDATDPDKDDTLQLQFSLQCSNPEDCSKFEIRKKQVGGKVCGHLALLESPNYETQALYDFTVVVQDTDGLTSSCPISVSINDVNEPHSIASADALVSLSENAPIGTPITDITYADIDSELKPFGQPRFSISKVHPLADIIAIDSKTGHISLKNPLDFESIQRYVVDVRVSDQADEFPVFTSFTLQVTNVNDVVIERVVGAADMPATGGSIVNIYGRNFGFTQEPVDPSDMTITVSYGRLDQVYWYIASDCEFVVRNTQIQCTTVPGIGINLHWRVDVEMKLTDDTLHQFYVTDPSVVSSYRAPEITAVTCESDFPTRGSDEYMITIAGHNFGPTINNAVVVSYGNGYSGRNCLIADQELGKEIVRCKPAKGVGGDSDFQIVIGGQRSNIKSSMCKYTAPSITSVSTQNGLLATKGEELVKITGDNFGDYQVKVYYQNADDTFEAMGCAVVIAHEEVSCLSAPGIGTDHQWKVVVGTQTSSLSTDTTSYKAPVITDVIGFVDVPAAGGSVFYVEGEHLGPDNGLWEVPKVAYTSPANVTYVATGCRRSYPYPSQHSRLECKTSAGTGFNHEFQITLLGQTSNILPTTSSYSKPVVYSVETQGGSTEIATEGLQIVVLDGTNFGVNSALRQVTYGPNGVEYMAQDCQIVSTNSRISCVTVPGAGHDLHWRVNIDDQWSVNPSMDYQDPIITSISGDAVTSADTNGGELITINGGNFGPDATLIESLTYGPSGTEYVVTSFTLVDHSTITCNTVAGVGDSLSWQIVVAGQRSLPSEARLSYQSPEITDVSPRSVNTDGTSVVTIVGNNFGVGVVDAETRVAFYPPNGGRTMELPILELTSVNSSVDQLTVRILIGYGSEAKLKVLIGSQGVQESDFALIDYNDPVVTTVYSEIGPESCAPQCLALRINGLHLYQSGRVIITTSRPLSHDLTAIEFVDADVFKWTDSEIVVPQIDTLVGYVTVIVGEGDQAKWTNSVDFSWKDPVIVGWETKNALCDIGNGTQALCPSYFRMEGNPSRYETIPTSASGVFTERSSTKGGARLKLYAKFVGRNPVVKVNGKDCANVEVSLPSSSLNQEEITDFEDLRLITCIVPEGQGDKQELVLYRGGMGSAPRYLDYIAPEVAWATQDADHSSTQGRTLTIQGTNLGIAGTIQVGPRTATVTSHSHDAIEFVIPPGEGGDLLIELNVGGQVSSAPFSYDLPIINAVAFNGGSTMGGATITLEGSNFGASDLSSSHSVLIGSEFECTISELSHTRIVCATSEGQGGNLPLYVDVSGQRNDVTTARYSYDAPTIQSIDLIEGPTDGYTCPCYMDPTRPCAEDTLEMQCVGPEIVDDVNAYCISGEDTVSGNFVQSEDSSDDVPIYENDIWTLTRQNGSWVILESNSVLYISGSASDLPQRVDWRNASAPSESTLIVVSAGACCPSGSNRCEPVIVTIDGVNFGQQTRDWQLLLQPQDGEDNLQPVVVSSSHIRTFTHNQIQFHLPPGHGYNRYISLRVSGQSQLNDPITFGYQYPELLGYKVSTDDVSTCGGYQITLYGRNFGSESARVLLDGRECREDFQSTHPFACTGCSWNTAGPCLSVLDGVCFPSKQLMQPKFIMSEDCTSPDHVLCSGDEIQQGSPPFESFFFHDHYTIVTTVPPGIGAQLPLVVVVGDHVSNEQTFSYNQPSILQQMPNSLDANGGQEIKITGTDFGCFPNDEIWVEFTASPFRRLQDASEPVTNGTNAEVVWVGPNEIIVRAPKMQTGSVGLSLIAGGNPMTPTSQNALVFSCEAGQYVDKTGFCRPCPTGATCLGHEFQPVAKRGYWWKDPINVQCEPKFSCLANNTCAVEYTGERCVDCGEKYHRLNGECVSCPSKPWVPIILMLVAIMTMVLASYYLTRKGVSLGLLSIGVDYFQVISMFGSAKVSWPPALLNAFSMVSAFNLNLEIIAPECWNIQVSYAEKWFLIQSIPLILGGGFLSVFAIAYFKKRVIQKRTTRLTSHLPTLIGSCLVMMYYLYLYITRTTFDVFNCAPTDPSDGFSYMGAVFVRCYESGGIHMMLLPWAFLAFFFYCVGYPAFVGYTLSRNRRLVMEDQLLRAMDRGLSRQTNPNCWDLRKKFSRLYYQVM